MRYSELSDISKKTLAHQGGPMSEEQAREFEAMPHRADILSIRVWDEEAKDPAVKIQPLGKYRQMTTDYLNHLRNCTQEVEKTQQ